LSSHIEENIINSNERMFSWWGCLLHSKLFSSFHQNEKNQFWRETNSWMNYLLSHLLMILIEEISKKKIHDYILGDSIIQDLGWSKNLPSLFKIWFEE